MRLVDEFRAIPWNARGRMVGRTLTGLFLFVVLMSPGWVEGTVFKAIGQ